VIFKPLISGLPLSGSDQNSNWALVESSFADVGPYISSGLVPTIGTGLSVNVSSGTAVIGAHLALASFVIGGLTNTTVNHLYLLQNGTGTSNTTGTAPANSVKLGTATTAGGVVTSVNTLRSSGRQVFVRPENQVPGAVGSPGSINLAGWAAAAADGVPVFGVLPAGAIGGSLEAAIVTPPAAASLTSLNVTTATLVDSTLGGLFLNAPDVASSKLQGWYKTLAAGSYTWIVRLTGSLLASATFTAFGLFLRDSAGGKILTFEQLYFSGTENVTVEQWSDANTRVAAAYNSAYQGASFPWLKIHDDGATTRTYSVSRNGVDWLDLFSEGRTVYLGVAPNQAGIYVAANGKATILNVQSWQGA
jgi:hypothetical protein